MARTIDATQDERSKRSTIAALPLVVITIFSDRAAGDVSETLYFSDRALTYDFGDSGTLRQFEPFLLNLPQGTDEMNHLPSSGNSLVRSRSISLRNGEDETGNLLWKTLRAKRLEQARVEVAEILIDPATISDVDVADLSAMTGDEHTTLFRGAITHVARVNSDEIILEAITEFPQIPFLLASDDTKTDPKDLGKRLPIVYGAMKRVPANSYDVGFATTLAEAITDSATGTIEVTDTTGFLTAGSARIGTEEIAWTGKTATTLTTVTRGQSSTKKSAHQSGESIVEIIATATFVVAGHEVDAINDVYIRNPYDGKVTRVTTDFTKTVADTATISGETVASVSFTIAELRTLLAELFASAEVTQQPEVTHVIRREFTDHATSWEDASAADNNFGTGVLLENDSTTNSFELSPGVTVLSQTVIVNVGSLSSGGGPFGTGRGTASVYVNNNKIASWQSGSGTRSFPAGTLQPNIDIKVGVGAAFSAGGTFTTGRARVYEIQRVVVVEEPNPVLSSPTAVIGASVGFALQLFADVDGVPVPTATAANYSGDAGSLIEKPEEIVRHIIADLCGEGHSVIDDSSFSTVGTNLGTADKHALILNSLGANFVEAITVLGFESRSNIMQEENASGMLYKMYAAETDYEWPASASTLSLWTDSNEEGRDVREVFTRFRFAYEWDPSEGSGGESMKSLIRIDAEENDVTKPTVANLEAAEEDFGRMDASLFSFVTIQDETTAKDRAGYYAHELIRIAAIIELSEIPSVEAYAIQRGDVHAFANETTGDSIKGRVIDVTRNPDALTTIRVVEVD